MQNRTKLKQACLIHTIMEKEDLVIASKTKVDGTPPAEADRMHPQKMVDTWGPWYETTALAFILMTALALAIVGVLVVGAFYPQLAFLVLWTATTAMYVGGIYRWRQDRYNTRCAAEDIYCLAAAGFAALGFAYDAFYPALLGEMWATLVQGTALGCLLHGWLYLQELQAVGAGTVYLLEQSLTLLLICAGAAWYPTPTARLLCGGITVLLTRGLKYMKQTRASLAHPWASIALLAFTVGSHVYFHVYVRTEMLVAAIHAADWPLVGPLIMLVALPWHQARSFGTKAFRVCCAGWLKRDVSRGPIGDGL
jgi:hypothetical protein